MAKVVGDIVVEVSADVAPLKRQLGTGSKSVRKFGRDFDKTAASMAARAKEVASAVAIIAGAVTTLVTVGVKVAENARELENMAQLAGVGVERFQSLTFAAQEYGVSQEQLADILKDVNDKMGDFVATGAGPLADFFENIAPRVGVTVEQFRRLNSADALGLYVQSLERANVSQAEMTFYMEAIANDATRLAPLLANNADEMKRLEQNARDLGIVLEERTVAGARNMAIVWDRLIAQMRAKFVFFASTVLRGLDAIFQLSDEAQLTAGRGTLQGLADERGAIIDQLESEKARADRAVFGSGSNTEITRLESVLEATEAEMNAVNDSLLEIQDAVGKRQEVDQRLQDALAGSGSGTGVGDVGGGSKGGGKGRGSDQSDAELDRLRDSFASERELLEQDYAEKLDLLNEFLAAKKLSQEDHNAYVEDLQAKHNEKMRDLEIAKRDALLSAASGAFGDLTALMRTENKKLFKIGQAAAIAEATVSGYRAAVDAWQKGMKIGGPGLAAAFAAASLAKTGALIAGIASQTADGGGYGGGSAGGGIPSTSGGQGETIQRVTEVRFLTGSLIPGETLVDLLNEEADRGNYVRAAVVAG